MNTQQQNNTGDQGDFDIMRYLRLVLERKGLFLSVALLVMMGAVVVSYVMPKKYTAKSLVFIEQNVIQDLVKGIAITPSMDMKIKAIKVTMLSRSMLLKVIKDLDLDVKLRTGADWDNLIRTLNSKLEIRLDEKKGVFDISYTDRDPVLARDVVNTLTRLYIEEKTSEKRKESYEATQFLAEQIATFKNRIEEIEQEIDDFKSESGLMLATDEGSIRASIDRAEQQLEGIQIRLDELNTARSMIVSNTPSRSKLMNQEARLQTLLTSYTEQHPKVIRLRKSIEATKRQIRENGDMERQQIYRSGDYQGIKVQLKSLETKRDNLEEEIRKNRELLRQIPALKTQLAELERRRQNEVIIYEKLVSRYGQSEVSKEMELQDKSVSFKVLDPAVVPSIPTSPNRPIIMAGGMAGGFGLALALIVLLDFINPSIKTVDDLRGLGLPVFAVVPKVRDPEEDRKRRLRNIRLYLISGLVFSVTLFFLAVELLHLPLVDNTLEKIRAALA